MSTQPTSQDRDLVLSAAHTPTLATATTTGTGYGGPLTAILSRVSYRPGWSFRVDGDWWGTTTGNFGPANLPTLHVLASVTDSNDPDHTVLLDHTFTVPLYASHDETAFLAWLAETLIAVERHESREFLHIDGQRYIDPHRDQNTRLYA